MEVLKQYLKSLGFSDNDAETIAVCFRHKHFDKGEFFASEGKMNQYLAFIETGVFQYFFNQEGVEITTYVVGQNGFLASLLSFLQGVPCKENIRSMTQADIWLIKKEDFEKLKDAITGFKDFYISILENQIICIDQSRIGLLTQSAEERYQSLLDKEPDLLQQVPLQLLASTLGITPRHLSRIRGRSR
ncbi:MAG: Crp/Fnr family transcriptional regulator [Chitinophagaceae bacterium]|nr:Crp/Fnr family transcriptional regulator [Chitinophagaceae bacterium]